MKINNTTVEIVNDNMMHQKVDAIVNAANSDLADGGGITRVIFGAAGKGLPAEIRQKYPQGTPTGTAVITGGHDLKQPYIIHTPGPVWHGGNSGEPDLLASSYRSCLEVADVQRLKSIAFCSISTGIYLYPLDQAAPLALKLVKDYLSAHPETTLERVVFAMFGQKEYDAFVHARAEVNGEAV